MRILAGTLGHDESGAAAAEYAVLVGFIALAIVVGVGFFGTSLGSFIQDLATQLKGFLKM